MRGSHDCRWKYTLGRIKRKDEREKKGNAGICVRDEVLFSPL